MQKKNYWFVWHLIGIIFCLTFFPACAPKKIIKISPEGENYAGGKVSSLNEKKFSEELKREKAFKMLKADAEQLAEKGEYKKALYAYNKAIEKSDKKEKQLILKKVDLVLTSTDPDSIKEMLAFKENLIPEPMLMYRLGLNLILKGDYPGAEEILNSLIERFPDYKRTEDAREVLLMLKENEFKKNTIGCMLPLSGRFSVFGQKALMGVEMAVHDLSGEFGKNIVIIIKDTKSDNSRAVQCVKELAEKKVAAIAGPMITSELAGKEADQLGVPIVVMTQKTQIAKEGKYIFSNFISPETQVNALVSFAARQLNIKKFAILYPDDRYGKTYMNLFFNKVDETDAEIVDAEPYTDVQTDFSNVIKKLIEEASAGLSDTDNSINADSVHGNTANGGTPDNTDNSFYTGGHPDTGDTVMHDAADVNSLNDNGDNQAAKYNAEQSGNFAGQQVVPESDKPVINFRALFIPDKASRVSLILPQLAYNDVTGIYLLGTNIWHDPDLIKYAAKYAHNSIITEGYFADSKNVKSHEFAEKFYRLYNEKPGFIEAVAYDTASILIKTAMDPAVNSRKALRDALSGQRIFDGVTGKTIFGENGNARKELFFLTIKKGKFVEINR